MKKVFLTAVMLLLTACAGSNVKDYAAETPKFSLEQYFTGHTKAWGIFEDRFGAVRARFVVDIKGTKEGDTLTLVEDFVYSDGKTEQRIWKIRKTGEDTYVGTAGDVIGEATGVVSGNALNWAYAMDLKTPDRTLRVKFDDWMYLMDEKRLINRAYVRKWGIEVGSVTLFFEKQD
ncbi:MAG: DUF3833 domain-containing protein [Alphaproteobacteria bacterium]|jgi:hypothetical protein|nr:DUF3833 domain-containing protein [Thalassospira sp.]MCE2964982.1 DUF3833 domain-containing protein [Alphaproteobacteria bacterium]